jgi:RNA polymerase sigma factor (sigma-70 family)
MEYTDGVSRVYKSLTNEERITFYNRMKNGDTGARNELIYSCLPLVVKIAENFSFNNKHIDLEDFIQEGNIALVRAVDNWNPKIGSLTNLVHNSVTNALINEVHKAKYKIKNPCSLTAYASKALMDIEAVNSDDLEVISQKTGFSISKIKKMKRHKLKRGSMYSNSVSERVVKEEEMPNHNCLGYLIEILDNNFSEEENNIFKDFYGLVGLKRQSAKKLSEKYNKPIKDIQGIIYSIRKELCEITKE